MKKISCRDISLCNESINSHSFAINALISSNAQMSESKQGTCIIVKIMISFLLQVGHSANCAQNKYCDVNETQIKLQRSVVVPNGSWPQRRITSCGEPRPQPGERQQHPRPHSSPWLQQGESLRFHSDPCPAGGIETEVYFTQHQAAVVSSAWFAAGRCITTRKDLHLHSY